MSTRVLRLADESGSVVSELLLPPRSLYVLTGPARFALTHEVLGDKADPASAATPMPMKMPQLERRLSIILRDKLPVVVVV
jgi:alkylated DNA repair dioxygenase AlkB